MANVRWDSKVLTRNDNTGVIESICVDQICSDLHEVFDTVNESFVPIMFISVSENEEMTVIPIDMLGEDLPSEDSYVLPNSSVFIYDREMKAKDAGICVTTPMSIICSIFTKERIPISINGLSIFTDIC